MSRLHAVVLSGALLVAACGGPTPTPNPTDVVPALAALTPFPQEGVRKAIENQFGVGLGRVSTAEAVQVAVAADEARRTALASRGVGVPGDPDGKLLVWSNTGFVYLASYTPPVGPGMYGGGTPDGSPFPAYLIQLIAPPIGGFPGQNTALVVVDARTGQLVETMGPCNGPLCRHG